MRFIIRAICSIPVCAYGSHIITAPVSGSTASAYVIMRMIIPMVTFASPTLAFAFIIITIINVSIIPFYRSERTSATGWIAFGGNAVIAATKLCFCALSLAIHYFAWIKSKYEE